MITVNANMSFTAFFEHISYEISVYASPANGGEVSGGGVYYYNEVATLQATANEGYEFVGWSDGSSENPHSVTVTGDATYTATFSAVGATYYTVTTYVSPANAGSVTGAGTYEEGTSITLEAAANEGYTFDHWNDGSTQNPRTVVVNNNLSFTAYFTAITYTITTNASPAEGGTVTGGGTYSYGATAVLTATPNANYSFQQWSDGNVNNPRQIQVAGDATYTAVFMSSGSQTYTLKVESADPSLGMVTGGGTYPAGTEVQILAYPNSNAAFVRWDDGNTDNPRIVLMDADKSFVAYFEVITGLVEGEFIYVIYPNPAKESIRILGIEANTSVEIYNSLGMLVKVVTAHPDKEIGIRDLSAGLYLMRFGEVSLRFVKTN